MLTGMGESPIIVEVSTMANFILGHKEDGMI
jgi:hypothetical protein